MSSRPTRCGRMLAVMRSWLTAAVALPVLTCTAPALDLTIDTGTRCTGVAVEVLDDAVLPGWTVHALAVLDQAGDEGWALATDPMKRLWLQPLPSGPGLELTELVDAGLLELMPGPIPGEVWLLFDRPEGARVWRLGSPSQGEIREAPDLTEFPAEDLGWSRRLVFVGATPYLLAAPGSGEASTLTLQLARLDRETLAIADTWSIEFWGTCGEVPEDAEPGDGCTASLFEEVTEIELLAVTQADGAGAAVVLVGLHAVQAGETPEMPMRHHTEVSSLELRDAGVDLPPDAYRHIRVPWDTETELKFSLAQVGADGDDMYVLAGVSQPPDAEQSLLQSDYAVRAEHSDERDSGINDNFAYFDKELRTHLLQVEGEVAIGQFLEGEWRVAPIVKENDLAKVDTSLIAGLPVAEGSVARGAGFGQFLIRPPDGAAMRVTLGCADDVETP